MKIDNISFFEDQRERRHGSFLSENAPRTAFSIGAARKSSANGYGMRWKPAGSVNPFSSSCSTCQGEMLVSEPSSMHLEDSGK